jgi:hypothetical protein
MYKLFYIYHALESRVVRKPYGKRPQRRPRHRLIMFEWILEKWEGGGMDWRNLA